MAASTCFRTWAASGSSEPGSRPPVSITVARQPPNSVTPWMRSRVTPGVSRTIAFRLPIRRLKRVDLPTFGRPTIATTGSRTGAVASRRRRRPAEQAVDESPRARVGGDDGHGQVSGEILRRHIVEEDPLRFGEGHAGNQDHISERPAGERSRDVLPREEPGYRDGP